MIHAFMFRISAEAILDGGQANVFCERFFLVDLTLEQNLFKILAEIHASARVVK